MASSVFTEPGGSLATVQPAGKLIDYIGDFSDWLTSESDTIASVSASIVGGTAEIDEELSSYSAEDGTATTWVTGGAVGEVSTIVWAVTTESGREPVFKLRVYFE